MPTLDFTLECPIHDSFRVQQVAGLFDVPLAEKVREQFAVEVPELAEPWTIGLIVGPSGSGKTSLARAWLGTWLHESRSWPADQAVVDSFGHLPIKRITSLLTAVGFSSPPSWVKPYRVLSQGERFRCDLARALANAETNGQIAHVTRSPSIENQKSKIKNGLPPLVVFDEFTSVVDRRVACIGSAAVSKAIRGGLIGCRFVAATCHYDVAEWLEPDWIIDMATHTLDWRRLRRPAIELSLHRCHRDLWTRFARHHYLNGRLSPTARCFAATWRGEPIAFCAMLPLIGRRGQWRISRIVTLPDYQGVGIGMRLAEAVAELHHADGLRVSVTASHPALLAHCRRSPLWQITRVMKTGSRRSGQRIHNYRSSAGRALASFEYVGESAHNVNHETGPEASQSPALAAGLARRETGSSPPPAPGKPGG